MKKRLVWILSAAIALTPNIPTAALASTDNVATTTSSQTLATSASEKAALLTEQYGTTSVQYALIDNGKITVSGQTGLNDSEGKIPLTLDTMYGIGSTSKVFTAVAVMKLVDEGKIKLDTPLVEYLPDFKMVDERYKKITPRMLLNHSSGLQGSSLRSTFLFEDQDTFAHDNLLEQLSTQSLKADPGAFSVYCNDGFTLAEILVERVSGMKFTEFLHKHIMVPLDLKHTKTSQDDLEWSKFPGLYYPTFQQKQLPNEIVNVIGTGGIYSTAEDMVQFAQIFMRKGEDILSDRAVLAMEQEEYMNGIWPEEADNVIGYGLGWDSVKLFPFSDYKIKGLSKGGDTILYHASLVVLPEQNMAAAVLSSGGSSSTNELLAHELLLQALKDKGAIKDIKPEKSFGTPVKADMPKDITKYSGYYGATGQQMKVAIQDATLTLSMPMVPGYPEQKFVYTSDGSFVNQEGTSKVSIVSENGRTYLWVREYATIPGLGQLAVSQYAAEKLESQSLPKETEDIWAKREGKSYYVVNEKYSSLIYMINPTLKISRNKELMDYVVDKKIMGPDSAVSQHQVPGAGSRDSAEYRFYTQKGIEYFENAGSLFVSEDVVVPLHKGKQSKVTVQADGYAKWYSVPKEIAGKKMTVLMPKEGAFAVYDGNGTCVNFTVISGSNEVVLPENGMIVFAGKAGESFKITLK